MRRLNINDELSSVCYDCCAGIHLIDGFVWLRCLGRYLGLRIRIFRLVAFIGFFVYKSIMGMIIVFGI